jgi:hypothetical protein
LFHDPRRPPVSIQSRALGQIYEIPPKEARALGELGVDHRGVLVGDGSFRRAQSVDQGSANSIGCAEHVERLRADPIGDVAGSKRR